MNLIRKHLSVANLLSAIALFVALSGVTYAATVAKNSVKAKSIAKKAVTTPKLKNGAVTTPKLRNRAVTSAKLADASVRSTHLGGGVVTTAKLKNGAVTDPKLGADAVVTGKLADGSVTGTKVSPSFLAQLVKNVSYATKSSGPADTATETKTASAICPSGKKVIGGGAQIIGSTTKVAITKSAPPSDAVAMTTEPTSWTATATDIGGEANAWALEAFVVCAEL